MNKEETILKYLDNQLSAEEKLNFEKQLSESVELQIEFRKYADKYAQIDELKEIESNQLYFNSILPRFQQKRKAQSRVFIFKNLGYAFSSLIMLIVSYTVFNLFYSENEYADLIKFAESLTTDEKIELLSTLNGETTTEYLNKFYADFYGSSIETSLADISDKNQIAVSYNLDVNNIEEIVTDEEFENIYNELLSMNIFNEEKL
jgi:hypothetical protein